LNRERLHFFLAADYTDCTDFSFFYLRTKSAFTRGQKIFLIVEAQPEVKVGFATFFLFIRREEKSERH
jgi:hypothetical protein